MTDSRCKNANACITRGDCFGVCEYPETDLLEKLGMIKEAVERNPGEWWREFYFTDRSGRIFPAITEYDFWHRIGGEFPVGIKPQQVRVEGEVDNELIQTAIIVRDTVGGNPGKVAQALLQLVKDSND